MFFSPLVTSIVVFTLLHYRLLKIVLVGEEHLFAKSSTLYLSKYFTGFQQLFSKYETKRIFQNLLLSFFKAKKYGCVEMLIRTQKHFAPRHT